ncbi:BUD32 family EKC/KEOPS complex subunit [Fusobacterium sp. THCT1E2]
MEKILVNQKRTKVIYDSKEKTYTKILYPSLIKKIKFILKIRKYPGANFKYIADILKKNGIKVPEIVYFSNYKVITKEIDGKKIMDILIEGNKNEISIAIKKYIEIVVRIIKLGIYFGDFSYDNFLIMNGEVYAIDLEDYRKDFFSKFKKRKMILKLKNKLNELKKLNEYLNKIDVYEEIKKKI